jgi:hypothetical protein
MRREREQIAKLHNDRLQHYGAQHLGPQLNSIDGPKRLRGEGGLINKDFQKPLGRAYSPSQSPS